MLSMTCLAGLCCIALAVQGATLRPACNSSSLDSAVRAAMLAWVRIVALISCLAWALLLGACARPTSDGAHVEPATGRAYRVISPPRHMVHGAMPVLFLLHAYATAPEVMVRGFALDHYGVASRGMLLVLPEGQRDAAGKLHWNAAKGCCGQGPRHDDLAYLRSVLAEVKARFPVDPRRVYAFGVSNGGFMAHRWACTPGGDLHAIVSIVGAGPGPEDPPCAPSHPVSVLQVHGTADEVIRYGGSSEPGAAYPSAPETVAHWRTVTGNHAATRVTHVRTPAFEDMAEESWEAPHCTQALWTVRDGDHRLRSARWFVPQFLEFLDAHGAQGSGALGSINGLLSR
jgi:polyhydroxybutyrate depolymerase